MPSSRKDPGIQYAKDVVSGKVVVGKWVLLAYQRFLKELELSRKDKKFPWVFDYEESARVQRFFPQCLMLSGADVQYGQPFKLFPWQCGLLAQMYGWQKRDGGGRRYSTVYLETAKGSGKSPLAAGVGLYHTFYQGRRGAQGFAFAFNRDQARLVFSPACAMARNLNSAKGKLADDKFRIYGNLPYEYNIVHRERAQTFRTVTSQKDARGKGGSAVWFAVGDEICEHQDGSMVKAMVDGMKFNRGPMCFLLTNAGMQRSGICWEYHSYAERVLDDERFPGIKNDEFLGLIYTVDDQDNPHEDEDCWVKAAPSIDVTPGREYYRRGILEARGMPSRMAEVDRLYFSRWTTGEQPFISPATWYRSTTCVEHGGVDPAEFPGRKERQKMPCWMACDLSRNRDITSFCVVWLDVSKQKYYSKAYCWLPEDRIEEYSRRDEMPYLTLVDDGHLFLSPGDFVDYNQVAVWVGRMVEIYNPRLLAFDPHRMKDLQIALREQGVRAYVKGKGGMGLPCIPHKQGRWISYSDKDETLTMPRSIEKLESLIYSYGTDKPSILIWNNPLLSLAALTVEVKSDGLPNNRMFEKPDTMVCIDPIVALTMCTGLAVQYSKSATSTENVGAWMKSMSSGGVAS